MRTRIFLLDEKIFLNVFTLILLILLISFRFSCIFRVYTGFCSFLREKVNREKGIRKGLENKRLKTIKFNLYYTSKIQIFSLLVSV